MLLDVLYNIALNKSLFAVLLNLLQFCGHTSKLSMLTFNHQSKFGDFRLLEIIPR